MHEHVALLRPDVRGQEARGISSCLAKDPANRRQSARELSLRLAEVDGAAAWSPDRARDWWATHQRAPNP